MLKIHFLNVGHGDCCIIDFTDSGRVAVVDINVSVEMDKKSAAEIYENSLYGSFNDFSWKQKLEYGLVKPNELLEKAGYDINLTNPIYYLKSNGYNSIFRFISTHPHLDHLSGIFELSNNIQISNFWVNKNNHVPDIGQMSDYQKKDWEYYKNFRDTDDDYYNNIKIVRPISNSQGEFYTNDGFQILSPSQEILQNYEQNPNNLSYVILIIHRGIKIILAGDAEQKTWNYILENYSDQIRDVDILKAAHHGRDSGFHENVVKLMSPEFVIVSVGKKPNSDASNKYKKYSPNVWSTRWKGNIHFKINDLGSIEPVTEYER